jgi:uncharacterized protein YecE (DUF72 family)
MPRRPPPEPQMPLFGEATSAGAETPGQAELSALAARLPPGLRLGTSSWTFEGWQGLVYHRTYTKQSFLRDSLAEYVRYPLFRTVGIDSTYYTPPRADLLARYAEQLPAGFLTVSKVWERLTMPAFPEHKRYGKDAGHPNPSFLDAAVFADLIYPPYARELRAHAGPFVFEFPPMRPEVRPEPDEFVERLDRFLGQLPQGPAYAVEIRNRELLTPEYLEMLRRRGAGHVLNQWSFMPSVGQQAQIEGILTAQHVVVRLLMRPGTRYEARLEEMAPFDKIVDPDPKMRQDVARLAARALAEGREVYVLVNNKAEGSAPLTVRALAEAVVSESDADLF